MTTITLEVPSHLEGPWRDCLARDPEAAQRILNAAFVGALESVLTQAGPPLSDEEFEALADQLTEEWDADGGVGVVLSEEAVSREGIYGDHP